MQRDAGDDSAAAFTYQSKTGSDRCFYRDIKGDALQFDRVLKKSVLRVRGRHDEPRCKASRSGFRSWRREHDWNDAPDMEKQVETGSVSGLDDGRRLGLTYPCRLARHVRSWINRLWRSATACKRRLARRSRPPRSGAPVPVANARMAREPVWLDQAAASRGGCRHRRPRVA